MDIIYIGATVLLTAALCGMVAACARLGGRS
jgi:hypothetical protein